MKRFLVLLVVIGTCSTCNVGKEIIEPYGFTSDANILCKYLPYEQLENAKSCAEFDQIINVGIGVTCAAGFSLVGYDRYECNDQTGKVSEELVANPITNPHSKCVSVDDTDICKSPMTVSAKDKVKVAADGSTQVPNIEKVAVDATDKVFYELECGDGYSFAASVTSKVYGYCTDNANNVNVFGFHEGSGADGCYAMCPASGEPASISSAVSNLKNIASETLTGKSKHGTEIEVEVTCSDGFSLAAGSPERYSFTCEGAKGDGGEPDSGKYSCGEECPTCLAQCPANTAPGTAIPNVKSYKYDAVESGRNFNAEVKCEDGFALAEDAPKTYSFTCTGTAEGEAFSGTIALAEGATAPLCLPKCPADSFDLSGIDKAASVKVEEGVSGEKAQATITCSEGFSLPYRSKNKAELTCTSEEGGEANTGKYTCGDSCPVCDAVCPVSADDETFAFALADGESIGATVASGEDIVEVSCKGEGKNILGERFYSCKDGTLTFDNAEPTCTEDKVCEPPKVLNGKVKSSDNVAIGGKFEVECNGGFLFDYKTADANGKESNRFTEGEWTCSEEKLEDIACFRGCVPPDFQGGVIYPDINKEGKAPYEEGATVEFKCLNDGNIIEGKAEGVCDGGQIPPPVCGCDGLVTSLALLLSILARNFM